MFKYSLKKYSGCYMSGYTGYIASSGYDLSLIFQGGTTNITTGFKLANGDDIATIF